MPTREEAIIPVAAHWIRPLALGLIVIALLLLALVLWMMHELFLNYGQLWRQAPIVETVYPMFAAPAGMSATLLLLVTALHGLILGRVLGSDSGLWFVAMRVLGRLVVVLIFGLTPVLAIGTTIALKVLDYRTCSELRVSGSAWQVFWVNSDAYCFKPDSFINGNWPCREIDNKKICLQADGR